MAAVRRTIFRIFHPTATFSQCLNAAIQLMKQERETEIADQIRDEAHKLLEPYGTQAHIPLRPKTLPAPAPTEMPAPAEFDKVSRNDLSEPVWVALEQVVLEFLVTYQPMIFRYDANSISLLGHRRIRDYHNPQLVICQSQGGTTVMSLEKGVAVIIPLLQTWSATMSIMPINCGEPVTITWTEDKLFLVSLVKADLVVSGAGQLVFLWICWS